MFRNGIGSNVVDLGGIDWNANLVFLVVMVVVSLVVLSLFFLSVRLPAADTRTDGRTNEPTNDERKKTRRHERTLLPPFPCERLVSGSIQHGVLLPPYTSQRENPGRRHQDPIHLMHGRNGRSNEGVRQGVSREGVSSHRPRHTSTSTNLPVRIREMRASVGTKKKRASERAGDVGVGMKILLLLKKERLEFFFFRNYYSMLAARGGPDA